MNKPDVKKLILLNLPYVFAFYFADKIAAVFRLAPGTEFIDKLTNGFAVFGSAFANPLPSFHPVDLLIGLIAGALLKLAVYTGRLGAQGLYNVCAPVSKANAQPGDLIFFVGTYDTPGVSHVGIYVGDGVMIHCGDPIQYTSINSSYWQQHFYAFGRPAY